MVKKCDLGLENAALGLRPRAVFSRPRSQFFTIRTSQPANNIYFSNSGLIGEIYFTSLLHCRERNVNFNDIIYKRVLLVQGFFSVKIFNRLFKSTHKFCNAS